MPDAFQLQHQCLVISKLQNLVSFDVTVVLCCELKRQIHEQNAGSQMLLNFMFNVIQEKLRVAVLVSKAAFQFISGEFQFIIRFNKVMPLGKS